LATELITDRDGRLDVRRRAEGDRDIFRAERERIFERSRRRPGAGSVTLRHDEHGA